MNKPFSINEPERNVFGEPLELCSADPVTGFFRNGHCAAGPDGSSRHLVCCEMTSVFLAYSASVGNDLTTARPESAFPGLHPGNRWCVHVERWLQALDAGMAPHIYLRATHVAVLERVGLAVLKKYAIDLA